MRKQTKNTVEEFWVRLPKSMQRQLAAKQEKWKDAFNKEGETYFVFLYSAVCVFRRNEGKHHP